MVHDSIPNPPNFFQLVEHIFFLQDLLNQEALSAGIWYVAIDFQLYLFVVTVLWFTSRIENRNLDLKLINSILITGFTSVSLFIFNKDNYWDETAFYFFGSYGLGILVYWISSRPNYFFWLMLLTLLVIAALLVDFRSRIAVAGMVMLILGLATPFEALEKLAHPKFSGLPWPYFLFHLPYSFPIMLDY
jgi:hypothetical protein